MAAFGVGLDRKYAAHRRASPIDLYLFKKLAAQTKPFAPRTIDKVTDKPPHQSSLAAGAKMRPV